MEYGKKDKLSIHDLTHFLNTYQRYQYPNPLSEDFLTLAKQTIDRFLAKEPLPKESYLESLSNIELYRLISASMFYGK